MTRHALFCRCFLSGFPLALLIMAAVPAQARAARGQDSEPDKMERLEQRVAELEKTVAQLQNILQASNLAAPVSVAPPAIPPAPAPTPPQPASAQNTAAQKSHYQMPTELIPEIGKIGAEVGLFLSGSSSPFQLNPGRFAGGYIDLPLFDRPQWLHGKISYEISIGLTQSKTTFTTTSNVAQVANLSVLNTLNPVGGAANLQAALTGTGPAPFPVSTSTRTNLSLLQVIPFSLKYTTNVLERYRLRPYIIAGFGTYVTIHVQNPANGNPATYGVRPGATLPANVLNTLNTLFAGQSPFGGPLVAGQISQSPELEARGLPSGHGDITLGYQAGGGMSFRLTRSLSLGFDARYNRMAGTYGSFVTYGTRIGLHF